MKLKSAKPISRALLLALLLCFSLACAAREVAEVKVEGLLNAANPTSEHEINLEADGEAALILTAYGPGTSWERKGAEAAVISVHVDEVHKADVVLFRGEKPHDYPVLLGPLTRGKHRLAFRYEPKKSARQAQGVHIEDFELHVYRPGDPLYEVIRHAPLIYGRKDANRSDVPLLMYHQKWMRDDRTVIQYTVIFSHEDGGTSPEGLMARWGRLTDIEWCYRVELDGEGQVVREVYQGSGHETVRFRGEKEGRHPLLRVCTKNNMFSDRGQSPFKFALVPEAELPEGHSREELMDLNPWTYEVMALEWMREGREDPGGPATVAVSDPRNYVYIEFNSCGASGRSDCAGQAVLIKLKGDAKWYPSDHEDPSLDVKSCGWRRVTVEVPPGKEEGDIEAVRFVIRPEEKGAPPCALRGIGKVFMLDENFAPTPSVLEWHGELTLDADPDTPDPDQVTFEVGD
ncbi:MAG TPA: hypothetical protein EYP09_07250 [Anaerolineae bacterium]|nr:hypothetical protein [Anaerolineae bacterium]